MFGLTQGSFRDCVKPELVARWDTEIVPNWFVDDTIESKRKPGLLKSEKSANSGVFVGLSSKVNKIISFEISIFKKCYIFDDGTKIKKSTKGTSREYKGRS